MATKTAGRAGGALKIPTGIDARRTVVFRPGSGGLVTDVPEWGLAPGQCVALADVRYYGGHVRQRYGWKYHYATSPQVTAPAYLTSVAYATFLVANTQSFCLTSRNSNTQTVSYWDGGGVVSAQSSAVNALYFPACVYQDQVILTDLAGRQPAARWSGANSPSSASSFTVTTVTGQRNVNPSATTVTAGAYLKISKNAGPSWQGRVMVASSTTDVTPENITSSAGSGTGSLYTTGIGGFYPAMAIQSPGTASFTSASASVGGIGTRFTQATGDAGASPCLGWGILSSFGATNGSTRFMYGVNAVTNATSLTVNANVGTSQLTVPYALCPRMPVVDAASHNGSLVMAGGQYYPNRLFWSPVNWDPSTPPGLVGPYDLDSVPNATYDGFHLLTNFDVPTQVDGDPVQGVISTTGPLLVLKKDSAWRVDGTHPGPFRLTRLGTGIGMIAPGARCNSPIGPFWLGVNGVYWFDGRKVHDLTAGKIQQRWRDLIINASTYSTANYAHIYALAYVNDTLYVCVYSNQSLVPGDSQADYAYHFPTGNWSTLTNLSFGQAWTLMTATGQSMAKSACWAVGTPTDGVAQNVMRLDTMTLPDVFTPLGVDAGTLTGATQGPTTTITTGYNLHREPDGIDSESRMMDAALTLYAGNSLFGTITVTTTQAGAGPATSPGAGYVAKALGTVSPAIAGGYTKAFLRGVNRSGRQHQMSFTWPQAPDNSVDEVAITFRDARPGMLS